MKKSTKLNIWEVWNDYAAGSGSVLINKKPSESDIVFIVEQENWLGPSEGDDNWRSYIHFNRQKIYMK